MTRDEETLFLPHHDERVERFTGRKASAEDEGVKNVTGFDDVMPIEKLEARLGRALERSENVYALQRQPGLEKLSAFLVFRHISDAAPLIAKLRAKKSPAEIAAIQHATDVSIAGHRAAWKRLHAGVYEYELAAALVSTFLENGCEGVAYSPIVGSGPNGAVLHYSANSRRADRGEVIVVDSAAECGHYASDITRTIPVSGTFTPRERELYSIVLGAQKAAIAAIKPGVSMTGPENSLKKIATDYIDSHGKDLHGEKLGKYFTHGLGHHVGIEVHDGPFNGPLEAGMVITMEPGIYIPDEAIGIRIEDVVLVTENGSKVLSAALPREPDEIEKALAK